MVNKSTSRVNKSLSKKPSFKFRWWMVLILVSIVALIGIIVIKNSFAGGGPPQQGTTVGTAYGITVISQPEPGVGAPNGNYGYVLIGFVNNIGIWRVVSHNNSPVDYASCFKIWPTNNKFNYESVRNGGTNVTLVYDPQCN